MAAVSAPAYRFVARPGYDDPDAVGFLPDEAQRRVIDHASGPMLVHGGPGSGKTTTLVEAVCARLRDGVDPRQIVVLAFSRRAAAELRRRISLRRNASGSEVPVYSFPALAFAILRAAAAAHDEPPPQLLKGPEQDLIIRELLAADVVEWPEELLPAVGTHAFTAQLRDLLLRATERGISGPHLAELGQRHDRPEWVAAARFMTRYVDVLAMRSASGGATYDSAEIIRAACGQWRDDPGIMARPRHVFVDELQDTDPASWELLELLAGGGGNLTAFGDTDSATFAFRGGDARIMRQFPERFPTVEGSPAAEVDLPVCHRSASQPWQAGTRLAQRLRGQRRHRAARDDVGDGEVSVTAWGSQTQQAAFISSQLRQAHLYDSVPWSRMAVLVKSATQDLPVIEQALRHAGVPVRAAAEQPVATRPIVKHLLSIIQCGLNPKSLDEETAVALLHSVYGGGDAIVERKLRQELRRVAHAADVFRPAGELLVEALTDPGELAVFDDAAWARPAQRLADLLACAREATGSAAEVLWAVWERAGLAEPLAKRAVSRDSRAFSADADLDAMMTLFEWVGDFCDRMPGAGADMFAEHVLRQQLPADTLAEHARVDDSVELLTAHAAKGREWDIVVVAGAQEGSWPNLRPRGSLLGAEYLVEVSGGAEGAADIDTMSVLLDEERRLFYSACTRARDKLLVCAISDDDENLPSRFTEELGVEVSQPRESQRALDLPALVAELRVTACDPTHPDRSAAIAMLARLAASGVPGADPAQWWGLRRLSDDRPLALPGEELRVSPSAIAMMDQCGLRWLLEKHGGDEPSGVSQQLGNLVHAAAEAAAELPVDQQETAMTEFIASHAADLPSEAPWTARRDRADLEAMKDNYVAWLRHNDRRFLAAEKPFSVDLPAGDTGARLRLSGIVDRVEADLRGGVHVVDLKTGKQIPSQSEAAGNTQLAAYQLAAEQGAFGAAGAAGASLVYVRKEHRKTGATQRQQAPLGEPESDAAKAKVESAAQAMTRQTFQAVHGKECRTCRVKQCCPLSEKGKSVTDES